MINSKDCDFSFSGLKTAVLYYLKSNKGKKPVKPTDVSASFEQAAIEALVSKTIRAAKEYDAQSVILSGGVAANKALRRELRTESKKIGVRFLSAPMRYHGDNAAMIGVASYIAHLHKKTCQLKAKGAMDV
jgi:N6-L-threonylcarbamoyladenine synthase